MKNYYLKHKEKIKKQSMEWREKNPDKVRMVQSRYRKKHKVRYDDKKEIIKILSFKERVSEETLLRMKENTLTNQKLIKYYKRQEDWLPKKRILEGV
jgi:7-cyano-7-deazaguanine synthase in queuosine biosynthesis